MKFVGNALALTILGVSLAGPVAFAQDHHDDHHDPHPYVHHPEWKKGAHMKAEDWRRGEHIDYRTYHLHAPPAGYEWREVDGNYVMAAIATGVVASVVVASTVH
jgi:Ni/Co efflux regulator RcnB